jgi:hypothetical protein
MKGLGPRAFAAAVVVIALLAVAIPVLGADPSPSSSAAASPEASPSLPPSAEPTATSSPGYSAAPSSLETPGASTNVATPGASTAVPSAAPVSPTPGDHPGKTQDDTLTGGAAAPSDEDGDDDHGKKDKTPEVDVTVTGTVNTLTDGKGRPTYSLVAGGQTWELSAGPPWFWGTDNPLGAYVGKSVTIVGTHHQGDTEIDVETVNGTAIRPDGKPPWAGGPWVVGPKHPGWKDWMANGKPGKGHGQDKQAPADTPVRPG